LAPAAKTVSRARRRTRALLVWIGWTLRGELPRRLHDWKRLRRDTRELLASPLFDASWYARAYGDVPAATAARHYLLVAGFQTAGIRLQGSGIADFGC
jgi:hypothetical protein